MALPTECSVTSPSLYKQVQGVDNRTTIGDKTILSAPGSGKAIRLVRVILTIYVAAGTAGSFVALEDGVGGTRLFEISGDAVGSYVLNFPNSGLKLSDNTLLNLTVEAQDCSVRCLAIGYIQE